MDDESVEWSIMEAPNEGCYYVFDGYKWIAKASNRDIAVLIANIPDLLEIVINAGLYVGGPVDQLVRVWNDITRKTNV